ncbi:MAG: hydrogenase iron-sulfur subunit [Candidatus Heimdallarchaeota archaeon]|nr:hydrogenase iron-sulfur subunit [Candidatus Heimdallarchaeota archaeon]
MENDKIEPKILIISTDACSYPGVDNAGQKHLEYSTKTYVIRTLDPVIFPVEWYLEVFEMGYDGIYIASCGTDSPYKNTYDKLSTRIGKVVEEMKKRGIHYSRIKLTAICTVCADHFVHELKDFIAEVTNNLSPLEATA